MSRKGLVKASVEREYPKIKKCLEEDIYFNIWVDASRKITVLPVGRPNNEKERKEFHKKHYLLFSSKHSTNATKEIKCFIEAKNIDERMKIINNWYHINDNDLLRLFIKDETIQYLNKCASKFKKSIQNCMKDCSISQDDLQELHITPYFEVRKSTIIITSGICTLRLEQDEDGYYEETQLKEITEYDYYYRKWLRGVNISYTSVHLTNNPKGLNMVKYTNKSNEEILKLYESIAKYLLNGIK